MTIFVASLSVILVSYLFYNAGEKFWHKAISSSSGDGTPKKLSSYLSASRLNPDLWKGLPSNGFRYFGTLLSFSKEDPVFGDQFPKPHHTHRYPTLSFLLFFWDMQILHVTFRFGLPLYLYLWFQILRPIAFAKSTFGPWNVEFVCISFTKIIKWYGNVCGFFCRGKLESFFVYWLNGIHRKKVVQSCCTRKRDEFIIHVFSVFVSTFLRRDTHNKQVKFACSNSNGTWLGSFLPF